MKLVSRGFTEGYYYKPRVDMELLEEFHEGIIALSACLAGEVARNIGQGLYEEAKEAALRYEKIFGKGNFFLELQDHGMSQQQMVNQALVRMSRETGHRAGGHQRRPLHLRGRREAPRHPPLPPDRKKLADEGPDALRGRGSTTSSPRRR